ncbi:hypothetical protein BSL78_10776 [Apostichopus japonicus]|uniref:ISXO2-like transposase domain-containing protein n=1 Tax=Stichopus japonicus TaxID=307972 RepID=A0A2G8KWN4_STIJA|nr:hypothetical protein BSL78_10776 [Apostichopus japonicus]
MSVRKNSWFEKSNLTIKELLQFTYWWSRKVPQDFLEHELGLSSATCVDWAYFAREVCEQVILNTSSQIGGSGIHVKIDESKFGKRKYNRGRIQEGQWVFGGREVEDRGKMFMVPVEKRDENTLLTLIKKWIRPGSIIHSDCWKAYDCLSKEGYTHLKVNHSVEFVNAETGACTNHIENEWLHAKKSLPAYGSKHAHMNGYLAEHLWRSQVKHKGLDHFIEFLYSVSSVYNSTWHSPSGTH